MDRKITITALLLALVAFSVIAATGVGNASADEVQEEASEPTQPVQRTCGGPSGCRAGCGCGCGGNPELCGCGL